MKLRYLLSAFGSYALTHGPQDTLPTSLGIGYSTDNEQNVANCLIGSMQHDGTPQSELTFSTEYSQEDILESLNLEVKGSLTFKIFSSQLDAKYTHQLQETSYTRVLNYQAWLQLRDRVYVPPSDGSPLSRIGLMYQNNSTKFRAFCGDQVVARETIGGQLYLSVKMSFLSLTDKETFDQTASASFASFASFSQSLQKSSQSIENRGSISLIAYQIGGDSNQLGKIFGIQPGQDIPILQCSLKDLTACQNAMTSILTYASSPTGSNFPNQFQNDDPTNPYGPGVLNVSLSPYGYYVDVTIGPSLVNPEILQARSDLTALYNTNVSQKSEIEWIQLSGQTYSTDFTNKLSLLKTAIDNNYSAIQLSGTACFTGTLTTCVDSVNNLKKSIAPVDMTLFQNRFHMTLTSSYASERNWSLYLYAEGQYAMFNLDSGSAYSGTLALKQFDKTNFMAQGLLGGEEITITAKSTNGGLNYFGAYHHGDPKYPDLPASIQPEFTTQQKVDAMMKLSTSRQGLFRLRVPSDNNRTVECPTQAMRC